MTISRPLRTQATLAIELSTREQHAVTLIAGLDEAGRGALAGPVAAAAVILPLDDPQRLAALNGINGYLNFLQRCRQPLRFCRDIN